MRKFAAMVLLFSAQAFACPDLTGNYSCTYQDGTTEVVAVTQSVVEGVTVYNYAGSQIAADNQARVIPDDQTLKQGTFRAWCDDAITLKTELIGQYYSQNVLYGDLKLNMDLTADGTGLKQVTTGSLKNSGGEYPMNGELTCSRVN